MTSTIRNIWIHLAPALMACAAAFHVTAGDQAPSQAWLQQRQARFEQWQAAHPNAEADLADLIKRTVAAQARTRADGTQAIPPQDKYEEFRTRSKALSPEKRTLALNYYKTAFEQWKVGEFAVAEIGFRRGLDLDPANGLGNYYYGDCLKRKGERGSAAEYMTRAMELAPGTLEGLKAEAELAALPKPDRVLPPPVVWKVTAAPHELWDCPECPEMVVIPAGEFNMGSPTSESGHRDGEGPVHRVTVPGFALAKTEVTQGQWKALMGENPSHFKDCGDDCPVETVTWDEAQAYVRKLSEKTGHKYRLPNEAEWEYACRAGGQSMYCGGDQLGELAWYHGNNGSKTHAVAGKQTNAFGLSDMSGNVWEWLEECWHDSYNGAPSDGSVWTGGECKYRLVRGGSWGSDPRDLRAACRGWLDPSIRYVSYGFRPARILLP